MQETCPFKFNFDPTSFKIGDTVSYRVPRFAGVPLVANITAVFEDHLEIVDPTEPGVTFTATRESRPIVSDDQVAF